MTPFTSREITSVPGRPIANRPQDAILPHTWIALSSLIMGVTAGVSVEDYLHSSFPDIDREYRDGAVVERSMPDYPHGKTQAC